jgi:predicted Zn-dependent peptidase
MDNLKEIESVTKSTLPNGFRILSEKIDSVKSISIGVWVKTGSRNERPEQAGVTHFLEHMLFKGTKTRTAYDIALSMEAVGGYLNAFTSSEYTCYYARCLDTQLERAIDVLSDMVLNPSFPEEEIEKEKKVVIEEMKMYRDSPDDYLFEEFMKKIFGNHPLGRPVIGSEETVSSFSRDDLYAYMDDRYYPDNLLIAVAGNVDHDKVVELAGQKFGNLNRKGRDVEQVDFEDIKSQRYELTKAIEQTHYVIGKRGLHTNHDDKYLLLVANTVLGGGMSSRLHQNVREKYGYCYSIHAFNQTFSDSGLYGVYVGTDKDYVDHVHELVVNELETIRKEEVPEKELSEAKAQLKGKLLLSQENTSNRMTRLAKSELYFDRFITLDELVENIDAVSAKELLDFSGEFFEPATFSEAILYPED